MASAKDLMLPHLQSCEAASYGVKTDFELLARLNLNEYQYDVSPKVIKAMQAEAPLAKQYVYIGDEPTAELMQKVADYNDVDVKNIILDEALDQAFNRFPRVFIEKGDNIVSMSPTYPELLLGVERAGGKSKRVWMKEPDFMLDADDMLEAVDEKTKIVFICNPNNPTSSKYPRDDILKIVENAKDSMVMVDECYYEYCRETVSDVIDEYPNLVVGRSFSKGFGLAGARMAYFIGNEDFCDAYGRVMNGFEFNRFGVFGAMAALDDLKYYKGVWKSINDEKFRISRELKKVGYKVWDSASSFNFLDISSSGKSSKAIYDMFMKDYRIVVRNVNATFKELPDKYISFGTAKPEINDKLIEGLKKAAK